MGEVDSLFRLDSSFSTFSIKAGCDLFRLTFGIYTTLRKQECIVTLVAFTVPSGNVGLLPTASTRYRLPYGRVQQLAEYAVSWLEEGSGRKSAPNSVRLVKCSQHAFRNFHLNTGLAVRGSIGFIGCINDGLCWDFGKGSRMVRYGNGPASFTNARSVFVPVFHLRQWKLSVCLGSCNRFKPEAEAQSSSASPDALIER